MEECGPCPVFASFTLAFALQLRKKHGKTSVRVRKTSVRLRKTSVRVQYTYYQNTHTLLWRRVKTDDSVHHIMLLVSRVSSHVSGTILFCFLPVSLLLLKDACLLCQQCWWNLFQQGDNPYNSICTGNHVSMNEVRHFSFPRYKFIHDNCTKFWMRVKLFNNF